MYFKYFIGMMLCASLVVNTTPNFGDKSVLAKAAMLIAYPIPVGNYIYREYVRYQEK